MKTRKIKSTVLIIVLILLNCQGDKSPISVQKINNWLYSPNEGKFRESNGLSYKLFSEDNHPYYGSLNQSPDSIVAFSKIYLFEHFGQSYFDQYFRFRSSIILPGNWYTFDIGGKYCVTYYYQISIGDYTTNLIVATYHDSLGNVLAEEGVVDRLSNTTLGMPFEIEDNKAVTIAKDNQFSSGYFPWYVIFKFNLETKRYVWYIRNQTEEFGGHAIEIDAITGDITGKYSWNIVF